MSFCKCQGTMRGRPNFLKKKCPGDGIFGEIRGSWFSHSTDTYLSRHSMRAVILSSTSYSKHFRLAQLVLYFRYTRVCQFIHKVKTEKKASTTGRGPEKHIWGLWGQHGKDQSLSVARKHVVIDTCRFDQLLSAGTRGEPWRKPRRRILSWKKIELEVEEAHKAHSQARLNSKCEISLQKGTLILGNTNKLDHSFWFGFIFSNFTFFLCVCVCVEGLFVDF